MRLASLFQCYAHSRGSVAYLVLALVCAVGVSAKAGATPSSSTRPLAASAGTDTTKADEVDRLPLVPGLSSWTANAPIPHRSASLAFGARSDARGPIADRVTLSPPPPVGGSRASFRAAPGADVEGRAAGAADRPGEAEHLSVPDADEFLVVGQQDVVQRHFGRLQQRTRRYFPMIERTLERRGLPEDLKYVAVIESALNPTAESHAGAAGMWQFMPETAAEFGLDSLTVLDPARSTDAAARLLKRLHRQFRGDWQLALAAYNAGSGRVSRIVRTYEAEYGHYPRFWDIHAQLPRETQAYVPRFIAVARLYDTASAR